MTRPPADFEGMLREALSPVDPPEHLSVRLEGALMNLTEFAAEELESWELRAMRDPRNWVRPAVAVVVGTSAGSALVLLRIRRRAHAPKGIRAARAAAGRTVRDIGRETSRLIGRAG